MDIAVAHMAEGHGRIRACTPAGRLGGAATRAPSTPARRRRCFTRRLRASAPRSAPRAGARCARVRRVLGDGRVEDLARLQRRRQHLLGQGAQAGVRARGHEVDHRIVPAGVRQRQRRARRCASAQPMPGRTCTRRPARCPRRGRGSGGTARSAASSSRTAQKATSSRRGSGKEPEHRGGDDAERALGADEEMAERIAGIVLAQRGAARSRPARPAAPPPGPASARGRCRSARCCCRRRWSTARRRSSPMPSPPNESGKRQPASCAAFCAGARRAGLGGHGHVDGVERADPVHAREADTRPGGRSRRGGAADEGVFPPWGTMPRPASAEIRTAAETAPTLSGRELRRRAHPRRACASPSRKARRLPVSVSTPPTRAPGVSLSRIAVTVERLVEHGVSGLAERRTRMDGLAQVGPKPGAHVRQQRPIVSDNCSVRPAMCQTSSALGARLRN